MNSSRNSKVLLTCVLALALSPLSFGQAQPPDPTGQAPTSPAPATPPTFPPNTRQQPETPPPDEGNSTAANTSSARSESFSGTVVSHKKACVLRNGDHEYKLDDQNEAVKYKGQKVKITGSLDRQSNTIHVEKIEEAPES